MIIVDKIFGYLKVKKQIKERVTKHTVMLADYPRCGVGWIRFMLGTVLHYNSTEELKKLTKLEMYKYAPTIAGTEKKFEPFYFNGDKYLLKTHYKYFKNFNKAIIIYRNPFDAIKSYYTHLLMETGKVSYKRIGKLSLEETFLLIGVKNYIRTYETWFEQIKRKPKQFLLIKYEDLLKNTEKLLEDMIIFLEIDYGKLKQMRYLTKIANMYKKTDVTMPRENKQYPAVAFKEKEDIFRKVETIFNENILGTISPELLREVNKLFLKMELIKS
ncbi:MAG: hypothetical protein A2539_07670 [Elusimicrobia bacterium RIFOXYD2_FULL_34_15]|nr:MAG: hypothetical protein A2539_07670 [Elusimicrobia bacterium RIFOXYD2_FULL_34_15]